MRTIWRGYWTRRYREAGYILRTFAHYVRDGLIPNMFPDGELEGLYHTADATLWFFHAIDRYVEASGDLSGFRGSGFGLAHVRSRTTIPILVAIRAFGHRSGEGGYGTRYNLRRPHS